MSLPSIRDTRADLDETDALDRALDAAESKLQRLLPQFTPLELTEMFQTHIRTHLCIELTGATRHRNSTAAYRRAVNAGKDESDAMILTTQRQVRHAFWQACRSGEFKGLNVTTRRIPNYSGNGKMHNTDTRCAFCDFVDSLSKTGQLAEGLADRVTL